MRSLKSIGLLLILCCLFAGCQDPDAKMNMTSTRWMFAEYSNNDAVQRDFPQPRDQNEYRSQKGCLSGTIEFRPNDPVTGGNPLIISDFCGRPSSQQAIYDAYGQHRIEYILNNATGNERTAWDFTQDGKQVYFIRQLYNPNVTTFILFTVYYTDNGNTMYWVETGEYGRSIKWTRYNPAT